VFIVACYVIIFIWLRKKMLSRRRGRSNQRPQPERMQSIERKPKTVLGKRLSKV
jgi:hypothetical protein